MIFATGDTHGERSHYWSYREDKNWGAGDYVIVCGDFGVLFRCDEKEDVCALGKGGRSV